MPSLIAMKSGLELIAALEGLTHERLAVLEDGANDVWLHLIDEHIAENADELTRRISRAERGGGPNPRPGWISDLAAAASAVRRAADIRHPLDLHGWQPVRVSVIGEAAGACPWCGGHDRFITWPASAERDGRAWCRRCRYTEDVIGLYRDLERVSFVRALEDLAATFAVTLPRVPEDVALTVLGNARTALKVAS